LLGGGGKRLGRPEKKMATKELKAIPTMERTHEGDALKRGGAEARRPIQCTVEK